MRSSTAELGRSPEVLVATHIQVRPSAGEHPVKPRQRNERAARRIGKVPNKELDRAVLRFRLHASPLGIISETVPNKSSEHSRGALSSASVRLPVTRR